MSFSPRSRPDTEEATDALVDGDQPLVTRHRGGRAAPPGLPHRLGRDVRVEHRHVDAERAARRVRAASSPTTPSYVGLVYFAQLGPLLFLAPVGGMLADILDRRKLLIWMQLEQVVFSVLLAVLAAGGASEQVARSSSACSRSASATR